ncbi:MAG: cofactor assembly of complex C subunit B, partial [Leptolyngbya sp. SIO4C5]|nr:cofactor assembly of complex C subunit B [Leptolyngbya sp. SIO4C5]
RGGNSGHHSPLSSGPETAASGSMPLRLTNEVMMRRGIFGPVAEVNPGAILQRVLEKQVPVYLVNLKIYPGRVEFNYLPENTQGVICQPMGKSGALILAANAPRSYTKQDENWIAGIAEKVGNTLDSILEPVDS